MSTVPEAIKNLKLYYAFKGYQPTFEECIEVTTEKEFRITDNEEIKCTCITTDADPSKCCVVFNPDGEEAIVLSIDNKLIRDHVGGIADGAVFNVENFHFIEFKSNAKGLGLFQVRATYEKAMEQLQETIKVFVDKIAATGVDFFEKSSVVCHVVVSKEFPRSSSTEQTCSLEFAIRTMELFNTPIELYFDQSFRI